MSGFSGIFIFDNALSWKLRSFTFPANLHGFYPMWFQENSADFRLYGYNNGRFSTDCFVSQQGGLLLGFEGINLTKSTFKQELNHIQQFIEFTDSTKGSFSGFYTDSSTQELFLIADHTASKQIFYYWDSAFFAFSSSIFLLTDIIRHFNIHLTLSIPASYMMLSLGYMLEDHTLVNGVKKVKAGHYIKATSCGIQIEKYHDYFKKVEYDHLSNDLLEELDTRFKKSIELEYEKDKEYRYKHLATLSGGLDSRLNVMLGHKYGYHDITCLTFSEGYKSDELTARKISGDLSLKHIILLLNNGFQLFDLETPLRLNNCSVYYFGAAQTLAAVKRINFSGYGLLHNGGLAESSKGGYLSGREHREPMLAISYSISSTLFKCIEPELLQEIFRQYPNEEMFVTYNRGFNAIHNGNWMLQPFTDAVSTYMETDFADFAYTIHPKLRYNGYLTVEWINNLHPSLHNYPWKRGINPTNNKALLLKAKVLYRMKLILGNQPDISVPIENWYNTSKELRDFVTFQFNKSVAWDILPSSLQFDIKSLYSNGTVLEKFLCISFLKSVELLFIA